MSETNQPVLPPMPRGLGVFVAVISAVVLVSALVGAGAAAIHSPPIWFMLGFEIVIAVAAVFGVLTGLGRFADGPALALACVAGAVGAGSLLGFLAGRGNLGVNLEPFLMARAVAAAAIGGAGAITVLMRRPRRSGPKLVVGLACLGAFVAITGGLWAFWGPLSGLGTMAGAAVGLVCCVVLLGLLAAGVQYLVGAFEQGGVEG